MKTRSNLSDRLIRNLAYRKTANYQELLTKSFNVSPGLMGLVDTLRNKMKIGIATSTSKENVKNYFLKFGEKKLVKFFLPFPRLRPNIKINQLLTYITSP